MLNKLRKLYGIKTITIITITINNNKIFPIHIKIAIKTQPLNS